MRAARLSRLLCVDSKQRQVVVWLLRMRNQKDMAVVQNFKNFVLNKSYYVNFQFYNQLINN